MNKIQPLIYSSLIIIGIYIGGINNKNQIKNDSKIHDILQIINENYVDTVNYIQLENNSINSVLKELDPHSTYISKSDFKSVEEDMQGSFSGIGVEFNIIDDSIVVVSAISGGPSEKLGIRSGDRIITVENENVASIGIKNEGVIKRLRGLKGTKVNIAIKRRGQIELITFEILRDDIPLNSVDVGIMLTNNTAYIKINRFAATTYNEMMEKTKFLSKEGMQNLILDLRGNPGGYLHIANQICDEFLKKDELIVFTKGSKRNKKENYATDYGLYESLKVIVLINEGSASASEIVAGALQDNDRGLIIGRRSFGKGLVQEQITLNDGSAIRLTTQRYFTPSGRCIQKNYGKNNKDYFMEQYYRNDSVTNVQDSTKYTTKNGRIVFGGGGITPDIVIKQDTNVNYLFVNKIIGKGWLNQFCIEKSELLKNQNLGSYSKINNELIYKSFIKFLKQEKNTFEALGNTEKKYLKNLLLATISKTLFGNDAYYKTLSEEDEYIQRAIKEFKNFN